MSDESSSDAESLFNGSESEPGDSYDENLFEPEQIQGLQPYSSNPSVPLRVVVMIRAHTIFFRKMLRQYRGGDGDSSYRK